MKKVFFLLLAFMVIRIGYSDVSAQEKANLDLLLQEGSFPVQFTNDATYPWSVGEDGVATSVNVGTANSSSSLIFTYQTDLQTEITFSWRNNYSSYHIFQIYVDGVLYSDIKNNSWETMRFYLPRGSHVIVFKDSIQNTESTSVYSQIKQIKVTEIKELEKVLLTDKSKPLTFTNDQKYPWLTNDGYISSSNYGSWYSSSRFSTSFTVDKVSKFSFEKAFTGPNPGASRHYLNFYINGVQYSSDYGNNGAYSKTSVVLKPGDYHLEWVDTIYSYTDAYISRVRNVELSDEWLNVEVSTPGTLGVEVLYQVNVLNDVELLKVIGTINGSDLTTIKNMKNLIGLDLSEAKFNSVPDYAFDGLGGLSYVKLPEGVTYIGHFAFRGTQILNIDIPNSVTVIGQNAFENTRIETVNFTEESQLQKIGYYAFRNCKALKEFIMPNTVTQLGSNNDKYAQNYDTSVFSECHNLKRVHFSDALKSLEQYVCNNCYNLVEVKLPKQLETIRYGAFYNTSSLRNIDFPESLHTIDRDAFRNSALDSVILPIKLSSLSNDAFLNCDNLKYVELPSYIASYNNNFSDCNSIQTVVCKSATPPAISNDPFSYGPYKSGMTLIVPSFAVPNYKLDTYWLQFGDIQEMDIDLDYWRISGDLMLTNNRRMDGKPDIDLYYGGRLTVGGNAPMTVANMKLFVSEGNPCRLLNNCEQFTVDSITTCYKVNSDTWYFFTPLYDVNVKDVRHSANASYVFRYYNAANRASTGTGSSWQNVVSDKLMAGQGYIFQCNAAGEIYLPAIKDSQSELFAFSEIVKTLETHESDNVANKNWNYVGNPYPCYYDIYYMDFTAPITVWDSSNRNYRAYSVVDDNFVLRPMQSFFVQKPDAVDQIIFRPEGRQINSTVNRAAYAPAKGRSAVSSRCIFNLEISGSGSSDQTRVVLNENRSLNYEIECDASKFMSMDVTVPQIFTLDAEGNRLSINERPTVDGIVRLGVSVGAAGTYTISAIRTDGDVTLYDAETGVITDLTKDSYTFESDAVESLDRFSLNISAGEITGIVTTTENSVVTVSGANGNITVDGSAGKEIKVYAVSGALVRTITNASDHCCIKVAKGAYIVTVNGVSFKTVVL